MGGSKDGKEFPQILVLDQSTGAHVCVLFRFGYTRGMHRIAATLAVVVALLFSAGCSPENDAELVKQFREDADLGYPKAQFNLGVMHANGRGGLKNDVEAVKWYRKAAEQGLANAQFNLGVSYINGIGIPQNNVNAYMWLLLARAQGHQKAAEYTDSIKTHLTAADLSKAQRLATEWWEKHNN